MTKIITFLRTFLNSAVNPGYYADVLKAKLSFSVKYFVVLVLLMTLVTVGKLVTPIALFNLASATNQMVSAFPNDLEVKLHQGKVTVNKPLPYVVPMPRGDRPHEDSRYQSLVTFDTNKDVAGARDVLNRETLFLITEDTVWMRSGQNGEVRTYAIPADTQDASLSAATLRTMEQHFLNMPVVRNKWYVPAAALILFFIILPIMMVSQFIGSAIHAGVAYLLTRVLEKQLTHGVTLTFSKIWQVALHATTTLVVLRLLADLVRFPRHEMFSGIKGLILMVIWMSVCLYFATQTAVPAAAKATAAPVRAAKPAQKKSAKKAASRRK